MERIRGARGLSLHSITRVTAPIVAHVVADQELGGIQFPRATMKFNMDVHGLSGNHEGMVDHPVKSARARRAV